MDLETGSITDLLSDRLLDPSSRNDGQLINTIFYVLSAYSESEMEELSGKLISSKHFRGAQFTRRDTMGANYRITRHFEDTTALEKAVKLLGGERIEFPYGDIAMTVHPMPYIPITIVLTLDDGEFPADARIFYDETIERYLDSEQTFFLTHMTISRLIEVSSL